jgi:hypothetical protein
VVDGARAFIQVGQAPAVFRDALLHIFHSGAGWVVVLRGIGPGGIAVDRQCAPTKRRGRDYRRGS